MDRRGWDVWFEVPLARVKLGEQNINLALRLCLNVPRLYMTLASQSFLTTAIPSWPPQIVESV